MKYSNIQKDIEGIFAQTSWTNRNLTIYPANYEGGTVSNEFMKLEIIPARPLNNYRKFGSVGQVIIQIYTQKGHGMTRTFEIADILDSELANKTLSRGTKTGTSSITGIGIDNDDNSLFRADYSVSFRNYN